jgi:hypothetical protein
MGGFSANDVFSFLGTLCAFVWKSNGIVKADADRRMDSSG